MTPWGVQRQVPEADAPPERSGKPLSDPYPHDYALENPAGNAETLSALDRRFLQSAIHLGRGRIGLTAPNPSVGALIVRFEAKGPVVVGRGVTERGGRPHGEVLALAEAGEAARGATCYVSLEPCAHYGHTPPCVDALLAAGIARVVIAMDDSDPRVSGRGAQILEQNGVRVFRDVHLSLAQRANLGHVRRIGSARPAVLLKMAMSSDGAIGLADRAPGQGFVAITGAVSLRFAHAMRARADAIMVGVGTVLADDPKLTCRLPGMADWSPLRVVLDSTARMPLSARMLESIAATPVRLYVTDAAPLERVAALVDRGVEVISLPSENGHVSLSGVMRDLAERGCTNLMVEGGPTLAATILEQGFVDRAALFQSRTPLGDGGIAAHPSGERLEAVLQRHGFTLHERLSPGEDSLMLWDCA